MTYDIYDDSFRDRTENDYCPYCNGRFPKSEMSEEHVIPQSIGGDSRHAIPACGPCNSFCGKHVDTLLSRHLLIRLLGMTPRKGPHRLEKHASTGVLKDGTRLEGHFFVEFLTPDSYTIRFEPLKNQPDGSIWLPRAAVSDPAALPPRIRVYRDDDLDKAGFQLGDPSASGMEPAFIKILLGTLYLIHGAAVVGLSVFDPLRRSLSGTIDPSVVCRWPEVGNEGSPSPIVFGQHAVWCGIADGELKGGVSLFGRFTMLIEMAHLDVFLPGGMVRWSVIMP
jgi:hypothetical protein